MPKFKHIPTLGQVSFTFGTLCAALLAIGAFLFLSLRAIERSNQVQQSRALTKLALADDIAQDAEMMQTEIFREVNATDPGEIQPVRQTISRIDERITQEIAGYRKYLASDEESRLYETVLQKRQTYRQLTEEVQVLAEVNRDKEADQLVSTKQDPAHDAYRQALELLIDKSETEAGEVSAATSHLISSARTASNLFIGIAILIAIRTGWVAIKVGRKLKEDNYRLENEIVERGLVEQELVESRQRLQLAAQAASIGAWEWNIKTNRGYLSPEWKQLLGYRDNDPSDESFEWETRLHPEDRDSFMANFRAYVAQPVPNYRAEFRLRHQDGGYRWFYSQGALFPDANGSHSRLVGCMVDVTDRKRATEQLDRMFALSPDMIFSVNLNGYLRQINPAFERILGYSKHELLTKPFPNLAHPDDLATAVDFLKRVVTERKLSGVEWRIRCKDLSYKWIQINSVTVPGEEFLYCVGRDVTERKLAEERLERLRTEHRLVLDSVGEGVQWVGADGLIKFENPAASKILGYENSELIGKSAHVLIHHTHADGSTYPVTECPIHLTLKDGLIRRVTNEIFWRKDGTSFPVEYTSTPVRDEAGNLAGVVVIFTDITERKQLEVQLIQAQKMETVGKLAGGIAHEFNSIMTAIIGQSELLLGDLPSDHPLSVNANEIRLAADRAAVLTRQLLAYGRKQILQPDFLSLNSLLFHLEHVLRHLVGTNIDIRIVPAADLQNVNADPGQIEQVIINLALNARDAMPRGGKLTLETSNVIFDNEKVGRYPEMKPGAYVMLAISDMGEGMSEEVKSHAFEPFFSTKGVGQGTGLGLATCYGIVKQSGGHISVYSEPGRGSTFKVYLPQALKKDFIPLPARTPAHIPRGTETILLVEDDPALLEMASTFLSRLGYRILAAADGAQALALSGEPGNKNIDLLFTDVIMPQVDGKELSDRIRISHPDVKILFTSAFTENAIVHHGVLNAGIVLLQKPFTPSAMANKVREVIDGS